MTVTQEVLDKANADLAEKRKELNEITVRINSMTRAYNEGSVARKSLDLVYGDRNAAYGPAIDDYERAANIMNNIKDRSDSNRYTGKGMALGMLAVKLARRQYQYKEDTYIDMVGYTDIVHMFEARMQKATAMVDKAIGHEVHFDENGNSSIGKDIHLSDLPLKRSKPVKKSSKKKHK